MKKPKRLVWMLTMLRELAEANKALHIISHRHAQEEAEVAQVQAQNALKRENLKIPRYDAAPRSQLPRGTCGYLDHVPRAALSSGPSTAARLASQPATEQTAEAPTDSSWFWGPPASSSVQPVQSTAEDAPALKPLAAVGSTQGEGVSTFWGLSEVEEEQQQQQDQSISPAALAAARGRCAVDTARGRSAALDEQLAAAQLQPVAVLACAKAAVHAAATAVNTVMTLLHEYELLLASSSDSCNDEVEHTVDALGESLSAALQLQASALAAEARLALLVRSQDAAAAAIQRAVQLFLARRSVAAERASLH
jgi:hypothetical protein